RPVKLMRYTMAIELEVTSLPARGGANGRVLSPLSARGEGKAMSLKSGQKRPKAVRMAALQGRFTTEAQKTQRGGRRRGRGGVEGEMSEVAAAWEVAMERRINERRGGGEGIGLRKDGKRLQEREARGKGSATMGCGEDGFLRRGRETVVENRGPWRSV